MFLPFNRNWISFGTFIFLSLWVLGCTLHTPRNTVAILDELSPPNFSINPPEITIKAGEEVTWSNHTNTVIELSVWTADGQEPGLFQKLGSKIGLGSENQKGVAESDERIKKLEETLKNQQQAIEEMKAQLQSGPEQPALTDKLQLLEEKLKEQEAQLAELKSGPSPAPRPVQLPNIPGFINSFAAVRVKFDAPGQYTFTLFQHSPNRRSSKLQGSLLVLP
jgi:uncharacterized coiled-coil protein SlyX